MCFLAGDGCREDASDRRALCGCHGGDGGARDGRRCVLFHCLQVEEDIGVFEMCVERFELVDASWPNEFAGVMEQTLMLDAIMPVNFMLPPWRDEAFQAGILCVLRELRFSRL